MPERKVALLVGWVEPVRLCWVSPADQPTKIKHLASHDLYRETQQIELAGFSFNRQLPSKPINYTFFILLTNQPFNQST